MPIVIKLDDVAALLHPLQFLAIGAGREVHPEVHPLVRGVRVDPQHPAGWLFDVGVDRRPGVVAGEILYPLPNLTHISTVKAPLRSITPTVFASSTRSFPVSSSDGAPPGRVAVCLCG